MSRLQGLRVELHALILLNFLLPPLSMLWVVWGSPFIPAWTSVWQVL